MDVPGRVLVAFDGSPLATDALAVFPAAEITVLNVVTPLDATMSEGGVLTDEKAVQGSEHERAEAIVDTARERADERDATVTTTETGRPARSSPTSRTTTSNTSSWGVAVGTTSRG